MLTANLIFSCECIPIQYIYSNHHNNNIKRGAWVVSSLFLDEKNTKKKKSVKLNSFQFIYFHKIIITLGFSASTSSVVCA